ncbi:MAG: hypothetical protein A2157_08640 [Deltaproteobacteria bacterium RBG_16_47_11]|nr:MAG: hypothetical protein A2157_08640 [Deltaproteobacteria bacterium RBG_16_47_11]
MVFGERAGRRAAEQADKEREFPHKTVFQNHLRAFQSRLKEIFERKKEESSSRIREEMKALMTSQVGIFRKESALLAAKEKIKELKERFLEIGVKRIDLAFNYEFIQYWELEGMLHLAEAMVEGALARKESRGSHFRVDYPNRDDEHWLRHTLAFKTAEGVNLNYKEVTITSYPPKERTY